MITGLADIELAVADVASAADGLAAVLGRSHVRCAGPAEGQASGGRTIRLENMSVSLMPVGQMCGPPSEAPPIRLVLATDDAERAAHRLGRRGLPGKLRGDGAVLELDTGPTHGVAIGVAARAASASDDPTADIAGLDHVVVRTPDPERAVALYGGRLGLDLRLDRTNPQFGTRLLFFVCGGLVVEISHDTRKGVGSGPDSIFGLAWRARDVDRAHARMTKAGIEVSEVRAGRRPGTRVFTVKSHTAGLPTLVIGGAGLERS
ncbi:MAG: VOC family protein [Hyphomicrobiaceae bacterium]